ncbi:MAG: rhodanese-like domain-containing protein [Jatrophihabitans sp.]
MPGDVPTVRVEDLSADAVILDVREDDEWRWGRIAGARHVPMNQVPQELRHAPGALTPDATIVVVCKMGGRSAQVTAWLRHQGYDAKNLEGGMLAWAAANRPMEADGGVPPSVV